MGRTPMGPASDNLSAWASSAVKNSQRRTQRGVVMMKRSSLVVVLFLAVAACAPKKIPGTNIDDTSETRSVLELLTKYRKAMETQNAQGVVALVDPSFRDDGGSASPDDDMEFGTLEEKLKDRFGRVQDVRLELTVKKIELNPDTEAARVTYSYSLSFRMPRLSARTRSETDIKQMTLRRVGDKEWKITSGI